MANNRRDWIVFARMVSLYEYNSCCVYFPSKATFICFKRVDWQGSEQEQPLDCIYKKSRTFPDWLAPSRRSFISVFGSGWGLSLVAVSDFGEGSASKKSSWRTFDCAQPMEGRVKRKGWWVCPAKKSLISPLWSKYFDYWTSCGNDSVCLFVCFFFFFVLFCMPCVAAEFNIPCSASFGNLERDHILSRSPRCLRTESDSNFVSSLSDR